MATALGASPGILAWRIPRTEEPIELQSMGHKELDVTEQLIHTHTHQVHGSFSWGLRNYTFVSFKCRQIAEMG